MQSTKHATLYDTQSIIFFDDVGISVADDLYLLLRSEAKLTEAFDCRSLIRREAVRGAVKLQHHAVRGTAR